jgi:CheY-like chemotaxis protein
LRNPLAPLRNALDVIRLNGDNSESISQLRDIMERQVHQMTRLVDDLLDMSRVELGKLTLRKERIDLRNVLSHAVQTMSPTAQARQQDLVFDSSSSAPLWVEGDETRLVQVFINLLHNATKFSPTRGRIDVRTEIDSGVVTVHVADNGPGVPTHMQGRIFDLFAQAEEGENQSHGGLGIGLALVRRLVERHAGSVALTSSSAGSDFQVSLPLLPEGPAAEQSVPAHADPGTKRRILLIEDHPDGRDSLAFLLRLVGHEVVVAENGLRGIELAHAKSPEIALIDIGLPDINGYEVAQRLRAIFGSRICLIALTGFSQPEDRARAIEAGFDSHTAKPVELQTLHSLLATYAPATSGADSTGPSPSS